MRPLASTTASGASLSMWLLDMLHWAQHLHPTSDPVKWPVGKVGSRVSVEKIISEFSSGDVGYRGDRVAPSVRLRVDELLDLSRDDIWQTRVPFVRFADGLDLCSSLWEAAVPKLVQPSNLSECDAVPISTSIHDDAQLRYNRRGMPMCAMGDSCSACVYPGHQGPLHAYLLPEEQARFDAGDKDFLKAKSMSVCLLCIRRDIHGSCLAWNAMVPNPAMQMGRRAIIPAPFTNLVNVSGGYTEESLPPKIENVFSNARIVGSSGKLRVQYDVSADTFYFDQTPIKVNPPAFLFQSTAQPSR